jgi:hypothetical protein
MSSQLELNANDRGKQFVTSSLVWLALVFITSRWFVTQPPLFTALSILLFAAPVALTGATAVLSIRLGCFRTIRKPDGLIGSSLIVGFER